MIPFTSDTSAETNGSETVDLTVRKIRMLSTNQIFIFPCCRIDILKVRECTSLCPASSSLAIMASGISSATRSRSFSPGSPRARRFDLSGVKLDFLWSW
jgi:hypothetical protein